MWGGFLPEQTRNVLLWCLCCGSNNTRREIHFSIGMLRWILPKSKFVLEKKILENNFEFFASNDLLITLLDLSDDCNPGYELAPNGTCVLCPLGTYRTLGTPAVCSACPSDKTTPNTGSTKASDCSLSKYQSYNIQNLKHSKSSYWCLRGNKDGRHGASYHRNFLFSFWFQSKSLQANIAWVTTYFSLKSRVVIFYDIFF